MCDLQAAEKENSYQFKIGFGKGRLTGALDLSFSPQAPSNSSDTQKFAREKKFDVTDRVRGLWRPDEAGKREIVQDLCVQAMTGEDKNGPWVVLTFDLCEFSYQLLDAFRDPLVKELGFRPDRILCLPTHCHMNVKFHAEKLREVILSTVKEAQRHAVEADVALLTLHLDANRFVMNRRVHIDGVGTRTVMFNDGCKVLTDHLVVTEQVRDWIAALGGRLEDFVKPGAPVITQGEVNPRLQSIFLRDAATKVMLGSFTVFASHPVIVSEKKVNGDISADYPGYLRQRLEEKLGGIALFAQGASGELRPLIREYSHAFAQEYGEALADELVDGIQKGLSWEKLKQVSYDREAVPLPIRKDLPTDEKARQEALVRIEKAYDKETNIENRRKLQNLFWFFYRASGVKNTLRPEWIKSGTLPVNLYALQLNQIVLMAGHGEIFHATRNAMLQPFEKATPLLAGNCNEKISYLPTREDFERGGYEPSVCVAEPGSTDLYVRGASRLLKRIVGT